MRFINGSGIKRMSDNTARRARLIGLTSAVVATVAIGVLLLSRFDFGQSFTRLQQLSLLLAAAVLWAVHMPPDWRPALERKASSRAKGNSVLQEQKIVRSYEFGSNA